MKQIWHQDKHTTVVKEEPLTLHEGRVYVKALYSGISLGTERLVANGLVPDGLKELMKVNYMEGSFDFPVVYGYSLVGQCNDGRRVHLMHPHQDELYAKEADLFTLPDDLPSKRATLLSNMETCINAVWDARLTGYENVLVIGYGAIGALMAHTLKLYGNLTPSIKEIDLNKLDLAINHGFTPDEGQDYDIIFHTSATASGIQYAIDHIKKDGCIIEMSWYGDKPVNVNLGGNFHYNRAKIISSQVSTVSPYAPIKTYRDRKEVACQVLKHSEFDNLITKEIGLEEAPEFYGRLRRGECKELSVIVNY